MNEDHNAPAPGKSTRPVDERYLEDCVPGGVHEFGEALVSGQESVEFARRYDPQDFHTDQANAVRSRFGGLIASGWLACALMMRMYTGHYLARNASLSSPGLDEARWLAPVRPGEVLHARVTVLEARRSSSKPDRGILRSKSEVLNHLGELVMTMPAMNLIACRAAPAT